MIYQISSLGCARNQLVLLFRNLEGRYVVSFIGFLPAENPQLIGIVVVDDPRVTHVKRYGGTIAAPIFRRIASRAMEHMNVAVPVVAEHKSY